MRLRRRGRRPGGVNLHGATVAFSGCRRTPWGAGALPPGAHGVRNNASEDEFQRRMRGDLKSPRWKWVARQRVDLHLPIHGLRDFFGTWIYETYGVKRAQDGSATPTWRPRSGTTCASKAEAERPNTLSMRNSASYSTIGVGVSLRRGAAPPLLSRRRP